MKAKVMKVSVLIVFVMMILSANAQQGQKNDQGHKAPPPPEKIMERFDTNEDGKISVEELKSNERGERLLQKFAKIDTNEDGFIDLEELKAHNEKRKQGTGKGQGKHVGANSEGQKQKVDVEKE